LTHNRNTAAPPEFFSQLKRSLTGKEKEGKDEEKKAKKRSKNRPARLAFFGPHREEEDRARKNGRAEERNRDS